MHLNVETNEEHIGDVLILTKTLFYNHVYCTAWLLPYAIIIYIGIFKNHCSF